MMGFSFALRSFFNFLSGNHSSQQSYDGRRSIFVGQAARILICLLVRPCRAAMCGWRDMASLTISFFLIYTFESTVVDLSQGRWC